MSQPVYTELLDFLDQLQAAHIFFRLRYSMPRAISVDVDMGDGRWEVDFFEDGDRYAEKFVSREGVGGPQMWAEFLNDINFCIGEVREKKQHNGVDAG